MASPSTAGSAFLERFAQVERSGRRLLSNLFADRLLVEGGLRTPRIWTGTIAAYPAPGCPLGATLSMRDNVSRLRLSLECGALKGERGIALVLEPGTYRIIRHNGELFISPNSQPIILPAFPQESGWHALDPATGIPQLGRGERRFLWRLPSEAVVPAAREHGANGWAVRDVFLNQRLSARLSAITEQEALSMGFASLLAPREPSGRMADARPAQG